MLLIAAIAGIGLSKAQVWDGSTINTYTSDRVNIGLGYLQPATTAKLEVFGSQCQRQLLLSRHTPSGTTCLNGVKPFMEIREKIDDAYDTKLIFTHDYDFGINVGNDPDATFEVYEERAPSELNRPFAHWRQLGEVGAPFERELIFQFDMGNSFYNPIVKAGDAGIIYTDGMGGTHRNGVGGFVIAPWRDSEGGLRLDEYGRVNIGAHYDMPIGQDYKLSVNGVILAEEIEVKLKANWPDYVFTDDYELMSLTDVEQYIASNGHLPGVPSASEVEEDGLSLGEMNRILMEKVEELTLHMIDLKKENEEIKSELKKITQ